jgi:hypothetical protein
MRRPTFDYLVKGANYGPPNMQFSSLLSLPLMSKYSLSPVLRHHRPGGLLLGAALCSRRMFRRFGGKYSFHLQGDRQYVPPRCRNTSTRRRKRTICRSTTAVKT